MNLIEATQKEMARCRELLPIYESIGPTGAFGKAMITADIDAAEKAIASNDCVEMLKAYKKLQSCE